MTNQKLPYTDLDSPVWIAASALLIVVVSLLALIFNYNQWDTPKDLLTVSQIAVAYLVAAVGKRIFRMRQRNKREAS